MCFLKLQLSHQHRVINGHVGRVAAWLVDGEGAVVLQGAVELGVVAVALKRGKK